MVTQNLSLKQSQTLNPRIIAQLNLFRLQRLELEQKIQLELEENPFLEEVADIEDPEKRTAQETIDEFESWEEYRERKQREASAQEPSFTTGLMASCDGNDGADYRLALTEQLRYMSIPEHWMAAGEYIIQNCNDLGYLELDVPELLENLAFQGINNVTSSEMTHLIERIKRLEPLGIGCRNIKEFYLLQIKAHSTVFSDFEAVCYLLEEHFQDLQKLKWATVEKAMKAKDYQLQKLLNEIAQLKKSPVTPESHAHDQILPDFILHMDHGDHLEVLLADSKSDKIRLNNSLDDLKGSLVGAELRYLSQKHQDAKYFIQNLEQRETHLLEVMNAIVKHQKEFFLSGDRSLLRPMILKDIAEATNLTISTVSRLTSEKYICTPFGNYSLKKLFSAGMVNDAGDSASLGELHDQVRQLIASENKLHPLTDHDIAALLHKKGYPVARRTVAKYREKMDIPIAKNRKHSGLFPKHTEET